MRQLLFFALSVGLLTITGCPRQARVAKITPDPEGPMKKFATVISKSKERKGFFDTYQKGDDLFLAVPKQRLGQDFLLYSRLARGLGQAGLVSGFSIDGREATVVAFERHGDRIFLVQRLTRIVAASGSPLARAVDQSYSDSVLQSAPIETERPDGAALINIKGWVTGDLSSAGRMARALSRPSSGSSSSLVANKDRSFIESVKAFPENLNVRASLTFTPAEPTNLQLLPSDRFASVLVYYTFARLPVEQMAARREDDRLGYFVTTHLDVSSAAPDFFVRGINRWRLEPNGAPADNAKGQKLVAPRQPIVLYLDSSIPLEFRPFIKEGVEAWQQAFAAAGWQQAIVAQMLPKDADLEDLRYPTIRWDASLGAPLGRGEAVVDPRSGEILGASITLNNSLVRHYRIIDLPYVGKRDAAQALNGGAQELFDALLETALRSRRLPADAGDVDGESFNFQMTVQSALLHTALLSSGVITPSEPMPLRLLGQLLKFTAMHEVGHVLGLRHNFKASATTPLEKLSDTAWIREHGLLSSVMDYPGLNLPRGQAGADWSYYPQNLGSSDFLTISYGYAADEAQAQEVARQAAKSGHVLGTDEDARSTDAVDPTAQDWDLSNDPLAWARSRADLIQELWLKLPDRVLVENAPYSELTEVFTGLLLQYASTVKIALRYVGGQLQARDHVGDPEGKPPFSAVSKARQREALDFLFSYVFSDGALSFPTELLARLGPRGARGFDAHRPFVDLPIGNLCRTIQGSLLTEILQADTFLRLRNAELKYGPTAVLTLPELFEQLTQGLWSELLTTPVRSVSTLRRDLQRQHIERLSKLALSHGASDSDLHALARYQLSELKRRLVYQERSAAGLDAYTRAHIAAVQARIGKILDAQMVE